MPVTILERIAGTTFMPTLVNTGATISPLSFQLLSGSETLVSSVSAQSSGDGHYYGLQLLPTSDCWYISQAIAVLSTNTYVLRQFLRARSLEVD